jgi:hypothetical protein
MTDNVDIVDRQQALLTRKDRKFLLGELEEKLSDSARRNRRYKIRNRIENGIIDFTLLADNLWMADIKQLFEPAYEWSIERHKSEEQNRNPSVEIPPLFDAWMRLFHFYSYGFYAGGKQPQMQHAFEEIIQRGIEAGIRQYQHQNLSKYQPVDINVEIQYGESVTRDDYFNELANNLPQDPTEATQRIIELYRSRRIPREIASDWIEQLNIE